MTTSRRSVRRRLAWAAPVATAGLIAVAVAVPGSASAGVPKLPVLSPAALLAAVQASNVQQLSGQVVETARLGLPSLPGADRSAALSWQTLVSGSHTANIAVDGPDRQRLGLVGTLAESDVIHNGKDVWTYASDTREVTHRVLAARPGHTTSPEPADPRSATPLGAANQLLAAVTPTTAVSMDPNTTVAGQSAYVLVLTPRQMGSTISRVVIAVDGHRHLPLRVQVFGQSKAANAQPVFETGFTSIHYTRPSASTFQFTVPKGATVHSPTTGGRDGADTAGGSAARSAAAKVIGSGWTAVVQMNTGSGALSALSSPSTAQQNSGGQGELLNRLLAVQPNGDRLLKTNLLNVLLTADGRVFAGAVQPSVLQQAATAKP